MSTVGNDLPEESELRPTSGPITRRTLLKSTAALLGASALSMVAADTVEAKGSATTETEERAALVRPLSPSKGQVGFVLSHEQFRVPDLIKYGRAAERAGFDTVWTSDHFQPWMENEGHAGQAWVTLSTLGAATTRIPFGTGVTCPTYRYNPAVVAEAFATLGILYPGRVFLGVGSGEALNEQAATGMWAKWQERSDRLVEAVQIIRDLWSGKTINHKGTYYNVQDARLYDVPTVPVPIYMAANGLKSMYRAGQYGDGLITDPKSFMDPQFRANFEAGAHAAGKDPAKMPVLIEAFVVVGNQQDAELAAAYWRFIPKAWKSLVNEHDPVRILHRSEVEIPLQDVYKDWPISTDPNVHVDALQKLFDAGATQVYVHSGQPDQNRVIAFYRQQVLPRWRARQAAGNG